MEKNKEGTQCLVCGEDLSLDKVTKCEKCDTYTHSKCVTYNKRMCPVFACGWKRPKKKNKKDVALLRVTPRDLPICPSSLGYSGDHINGNPTPFIALGLAIIFGSFVLTATSMFMDIGGKYGQTMKENEVFLAKCRATREILSAEASRLDVSQRIVGGGYNKSVEGKKKTTDSWGNCLYVQIEDKAGVDQMIVSSVGPDGELKTPDDIVEYRYSSHVIKSVGKAAGNVVEAGAKRVVKGVIRGTVEAVKETFKETKESIKEAKESLKKSREAIRDRKDKDE